MKSPSGMHSEGSLKITTIWDIAPCKLVEYLFIRSFFNDAFP
jgi:hypothetical protein